MTRVGGLPVRMRIQAVVVARRLRSKKRFIDQKPRRQCDARRHLWDDPTVEARIPCHVPALLRVDTPKEGFYRQTITGRQIWAPGLSPGLSNRCCCFARRCCRKVLNGATKLSWTATVPLPSKAEESSPSAPATTMTSPCGTYRYSPALQACKRSMNHKSWLIDRLCSNLPLWQMGHPIQQSHEELR
jgi:hypothetical protein